MSTSLVVGTEELIRQAGLCFSGKEYKLFLATNTGSLTADSPVEEWLAAEVSGGGYLSVVGTVGDPAFNEVLGKVAVPDISGLFEATASWSYDSVCLWFTGEDFLHSVTTEAPAISLSAGQNKGYTLSLLNYYA